MTLSRKQKITPRALLDLKMPGEVQVAPDSRRIAFTVTETRWDDNSVVPHLFVIAADEDVPARQVTRGRDGETAARWSPDGKWLAFLAARDDEDAPLDEDDYPDPKTANLAAPDGWRRR